MSINIHKVAFQGEQGSNSHAACRAVFPDADYLPCATFEDCFTALEKGGADRAMIAIENSVAGRVADIHHLMPEMNSFIVGEFFLPIHFSLMAPQGATFDTLKSVQSHVMALGQCRKIIKRLKLTPIVGADTAGSAREIAARGDPGAAVLAPPGAAELYKLAVLEKNVEDAPHNATRFLILANEEIHAPFSDQLTITTFMFRVKNIPAALYKVLGGFATNGVNMTKLESYQIDGQFFATQFYADIEGHPEAANVKRALEELHYFSAKMRILGVYRAHEFRGNIEAQT